MSGMIPDQDDYPYAARQLAPTMKTHWPMWRVSWGFIHRMLWHLLAAGAVVLMICAIGIAIVAYRARRQAEIVAQLSKHELYYVYWHEFDDYDDRVPGFLREWLGDDFWNDIGYINGHAETMESTDAFCEAFGKLTRLRGIGVTSDSLTLDRLSKWPHFSRLRDVAIWSPLIANEHLSQFARIPTIRKLSLRSPKITDAGLQHLGPLSQLESLELFSANLSDGGLLNLKGFPHLKTLTIVDSPDLNDNAILNLGPMPELEEVSIAECSIGDATLAHLASGGKLLSLKLNRTQVGDLGLAALAKCENLSDLELNDTKVTDEGLKSLATTHLSIVWLQNTAITDEGFRVLMELPTLSYCWLRDTKIAGVGAKFREGGRERMDFVDLTGCPVTPEGFDELAHARFSAPFGAATTLWLNRTPMTDKDLLLFVDNDDLEKLNVSATRVTAAGVNRFYEARKRRLEAAGQQETLELNCDYPEAAEAYLPKND